MDPKITRHANASKVEKKKKKRKGNRGARRGKGGGKKLLVADGRAEQKT